LYGAGAKQEQAAAAGVQGMLGTTSEEGASPVIAVPKIKQRKFANGDRYVGGWLKGLVSCRRSS
jgi:hypothetical protein